MLVYRGGGGTFTLDGIHAEHGMVAAGIPIIKTMWFFGDHPMREEAYPTPMLRPCVPHGKNESNLKFLGLLPKDE